MNQLLNNPDNAQLVRANGRECAEAGSRIPRQQPGFFRYWVVWGPGAGAV